MFRFIKTLFNKEINTRFSIQSIRFLIAGLIAFYVDFSTLIILMEVTEIGYFISSFIGYVTGGLISYLFSIRWIFKNKKYTNIFIEFMLFSVFLTIGLSLNQLLMFGLIEHFNLYYIYAKLITIILVAIFNFTTRKFLIFQY